MGEDRLRTVDLVDVGVAAHGQAQIYQRRIHWICVSATGSAKQTLEAEDVARLVQIGSNVSNLVFINCRIPDAPYDLLTRFGKLVHVSLLRYSGPDLLIPAGVTVDYFRSSGKLVEHTATRSCVFVSSTSQIRSL